MADKPSYLGLLNGLSLAESRAHKYLSAWAAVTTESFDALIGRRRRWRLTRPLLASTLGLMTDPRCTAMLVASDAPSHQMCA